MEFSLCTWEDGMYFLSKDSLGGLHRVAWHPRPMAGSPPPGLLGPRAIQGVWTLQGDSMHLCTFSSPDIFLVLH